MSNAGLIYYTLKFDPDEVKPEYRSMYNHAMQILKPMYDSAVVLCSALESAKANWSLDIAHLHVTEWYGNYFYDDNCEFVRSMRGDDFLATFSQSITQ